MTSAWKIRSFRLVNPMNSGPPSMSRTAIGLGGLSGTDTVGVGPGVAVGTGGLSVTGAVGVAAGVAVSSGVLTGLGVLGALAVGAGVARDSVVAIGPRVLGVPVVGSGVAVGSGDRAPQPTSAIRRTTASIARTDICLLASGPAHLPRFVEGGREGRMGQCVTRTPTAISGQILTHSLDRGKS